MTKKEFKSAIISLTFMGLCFIVAYYNRLLGLIVFGSAALAFMLYVFATTWKLKRYGGKIPGTIIYLDDNTPFIDFKTPDGDRVKGVPFISGSFHIAGRKLKNYGQNEEIKIAYNQKDPSEFIVLNIINRDIIIIIIFFTVLFIFIAVMAYKLLH